MTQISIVGGDLRIVQLAEMLSKENFEIYVYGLEKSDVLNNNTEIHKCNTLEEVTTKSDIILSSIPLTSGGTTITMPFSDNKIETTELKKILDNKIFIAGRIPEELYNQMPTTKIVDLLKREELTVLNAIATAEGTIQVAMEETSRTLHGSNVLITGFGRITKILANMLNGIGANIYCETTKLESVSWIKAYGYTPIMINKLNQNLGKFDLIVNTIPQIIFDDTNLDLIKKDCVIIDVASAPGGVDQKAIKSRNLKFIWALALPGKVAPVTSAEYIKDTLYNVLEEL